VAEVQELIGVVTAGLAPGRQKREEEKEGKSLLSHILLA